MTTSIKSDAAAYVTTFLIGVLFAVGLAVSGMTQPQKVLGFLDLHGSWNPGLLLVLAGAVTTYFICFQFIRRRQAPVLLDTFSLPTKRTIDRSLVIGALTFGVGWGLAGFCPGPALAMLGSGNLLVLTFVLSMTVGMFVFESVSNRFNEPDGGGGIEQLAEAAPASVPEAVKQS
jgi:Predicted transporter component